MAKVYRVEDWRGGGPYNGAHAMQHVSWGDPLYDAIRQGPRHPVPYQEGIGAYAEAGNNYRFGFRSIEQLKKWFNTSERRALAKRKFRVRVFDVPSKHVHYGNSGKQVVFNRRAAKRAGELNLATV